jgi:lactate dehydrogenase-like 2-hydroxyacid dehydrogenase
LCDTPGGHILGIVGLGSVGLAVARRALALGMKIHYHGRARKSAEVEASLGRAVYHGSPGSLFAIADCILLACPYTEATHHLLNREVFENQVKDGVRIVNVARGPVIDEAALVEALERGKIGGVGLDVYEHEPKVHSGLLKSRKATLLPHVGAGARSSYSVGPEFPI